jgi:hypothetical protein
LAQVEASSLADTAIVYPTLLAVIGDVAAPEDRATPVGPYIGRGAMRVPRLQGVTSLATSSQPCYRASRSWGRAPPRISAA